MNYTDTVKQEQAYAVERLLSFYLKEGDRVYTVIRHVSASGMSRDLSLYVARDGEIMNITYYAAHALGWHLVERNGHRALRVSGCGMDMGFHTVYTLARVLFNFPTRESDAGYSLKQEWL